MVGFGKERSVELKRILDRLPPLLVTFSIGSTPKSSSVLEFLSKEDDTFSLVSKKECQVSRPLNSVQLYELMSTIVSLKKKIVVSIDDNNYRFGCFRAAMYAYVYDEGVEWKDEMIRGFTDGSPSDVVMTKDIYQFLQTMEAHGK
ncbi:hypothetical protein [Spirosoma oryzicola]|uniref:hypothetical protein n=1 Tax=Spirosoma oryzicola TaxID=2898794 RepID=UPI001E3929C8|nr:hypothetical protein [Spirosoma oryzicola]UHG90084.1 hypothetical protein LQ777_17745 [Spirosoma oryzicola]